MYLKIIGGHSENAVRQMTLFVLPTSICCLIALRGGGVGASLQKRGDRMEQKIRRGGILILLIALLPLFLAAALLGSRAQSAGASAEGEGKTYTPVIVSELLQNTGFIWFRLSDCDYTTDANIELKKIDGYAEKLDALNTLSYVSVDGEPLRERFSSFEGKDPYFNLFSKIPPSFAFNIGGDLAKPCTVTVQEGCEFPSGGYMEGTSEEVYTAKQTVVFHCSGDGPWIGEIQYEERDVTAQVQVPFWAEEWADGAHLRFKFPELYIDEGDYTVNYRNGYLLDYITVNGKTIREINAETAENEYNYTTFPGNIGGKYATAVYAYIANTATYTFLDVHIHRDYMSALDGLTIGLKKGLYLISGEVKSVISETLTYRDVYGTFIGSDDLQGEEIVTAEIDGARSQLLPDGSASLRAEFAGADLTALGYGPNEYDAASIFGNIKLNGVALSVINAGDLSGYDWSVCRPFSLGGTYQKPVNVYFNDSYVDIRVHPAYLQNVIGDEAIVLEIGPAFSVIDVETGITYRTEGTVSDVALPARFTLTLKNGEECIGERKVAEGRPLDLYGVKPEKEFYDWIGWTEEDGVTPPASAMPSEPYTLCAAFSPTEYAVRFMNGEEQVAECRYTVEDNSITEPAPPAAPTHYTAGWEEYTADGGDKTVRAVFTPIRYSVVFMADGKQVGEVQYYTVENTDIVLYEVPPKEGYIACGWEIFVLDGGDKVVNAVYEKSAS